MCVDPKVDCINKICDISLKNLSFVKHVTTFLNRPRSMNSSELNVRNQKISETVIVIRKTAGFVFKLISKTLLLTFPFFLYSIYQKKKKKPEQEIS